MHSANILGSSMGTVAHLVLTGSATEKRFSRVHSVNILDSSMGTVAHLVLTSSVAEESFSSALCWYTGLVNGNSCALVLTGSATEEFLVYILSVYWARPWEQLRT